jgi:serine/threonine-protein kinase
MAEKPQLSELLEEALDSGSTPEELCAECPELIPELRRRLQLCRVVRNELGAIFPSDTIDPDEAERQSEDSPPAIPGYQCYSVLGRGGMGVVYKARHLSLKRLVAIKMLLSGVHSSANERTRMRREAESLAKLAHPNIVQVYDVGELDGQPFFTMELIEGGSLADKLKGQPQPSDFAVSMMIDLANAVEAAHQCGIVHRDLKPSNVLMTAGGTPKISDFGLAREMEGTELLTLPCSRMGTPSYMAPEQASKHWGEVGCAADIYALGAILYEMMTGRPPFRGESPADTERQLLHEEIVPPSKLNARVPRDLETICLKCLQKNQDRRYSSVAALAEDLTRFRHGKPILGRRVSRFERGWKWVRRRPASATAVGASILVAIILAVGTTWIISQNSSRRKLIEIELGQAVDFQKNAQWQKAHEATDRANTLLKDYRPEDLLRRFETVQHDSQVIVVLDQIRLKGELERFQRIDSDYRDALKSEGIGSPAEAPEVVATRIRGSNIRYAWINALDDWLCFSDHDRPWVLEVVRRADHDPTGWRDRIRDPAVWDHREVLAVVALKASYADQPVSFLLWMARHLNENHLSSGSAITLLNRIHEAHPSDFWVNFTLADQFAKQQNLGEELRCLHAAEAIRPQAAIVRILIANVLLSQGRNEEAISQYREAVQLEDGSPGSKEFLGAALSKSGHDAEAIPMLEEAVHVDPTNPRHAMSYYFLGESLQRAGRADSAVSAYRQAVKFGPFAQAQQALQGILIRQGHWDQVESIWQDLIKSDPARHDSWDGYAEYCLFSGRTDEYRRIRKLLLDRFGKDDRPTVCDRAGRACLLLGDDPQAIAPAAAMVDRAVQGKGPENISYQDYFLVAKGLADYRQGKFEDALQAVEGHGAHVLKPLPQLIAAMAHYRLGQRPIARKMLAESMFAFDWSRQNATTHEAWINHVVRREAEQLILPNFNALVDGSEEPRDNNERIALTGVCTFEDWRGRRAQLWLDIVQAQPDWGKGNFEECARIARFAASAGAGQGKDAAKFTDDDRTRWRKAALSLLTKRIDYIESVLNSANPQKAAVHSNLLAFQQDPDLAGLRDPPALASLPQAEQEQCVKIWQRISTLLERTNQAK